MNNAQGRIHSFVHDNSGTRVVVDVDAAEACPRCAAGKGCGAALFTNSGRRVEASVPDDLSLDAGDVVELSLAPDSLLRAALIVYGLPLIGAVAAVSIAWGLSLGDVAASISALAGLLLGLAIARRHLGKQRCLRQFVPTISRRLQKCEVLD
jgi:sigma-E factor negative regulatory protein RseC